MTSPAPSVTVMIRPAADETITRDGRPLGQAVTSYVADGAWTGFASEVKNFQWQRCKAFRTRRRDGLTTTAAAAVAAGRCWSCLSACADSLHGHVLYDQSEDCPYTYEPRLIARLLGVVLEAVNAYGGKVFA